MPDILDPKTGEKWRLDMQTGTLTKLPYMNGTPAPLQCAACGTELGNERAVATTPGGVKYFCKQDPEHPESSCYLTWKMRHN